MCTLTHIYLRNVCIVSLWYLIFLYIKLWHTTGGRCTNPTIRILLNNLYYMSKYSTYQYSICVVSGFLLVDWPFLHWSNWGSHVNSESALKFVYNPSLQIIDNCIYRATGLSLYWNCFQLAIRHCKVLLNQIYMWLLEFDKWEYFYWLRGGCLGVWLTIPVLPFSFFGMYCIWMEEKDLNSRH